MRNAEHLAVVLFALILVCVGATAHSAGVDMKEGEWEMSSETSMTMGAMSMPPTASRSTYCLSREDMVPKSEKEKDCRIVKQRVVGSTVSWRIECRNSEGEGEITYRGSTYKGNFRMKTVEDGQTMTMNMKMSGKYLGPCPKGRKSGPTGETSKQMDAANEAAANARKRQADVESVKPGVESEAPPAPDENKILKNPVKGIRNLLGF